MKPWAFQLSEATLSVDNSIWRVRPITRNQYSLLPGIYRLPSHFYIEGSEYVAVYTE